MNITITGDIGSGKSTVSKLLAELLNMKIVDSGALYREFSTNKGLDVLQQNKSDDWSIDREIDSTIERLGREEDNIIFVSRLAWHFVPDAIKIYLIINPVTAAKRIAVDKIRTGEKHTNWKDTLLYNQERKELELKRYSTMYGLKDPSGLDDADIVMVVGKNDAETVAKCLYNIIRNNRCGYFIDPKVMLPTQSIRDYNMQVLDEYVKSLPTDLPIVEAYIWTCLGNYYIGDGHHRVLAAIKLNIDFICIPLPVDVKHKPMIPNIYNYEDISGVSFDDECLLHTLCIEVATILNEYRSKFGIEDDSSWLRELKRLQELFGTSDKNELAANIQQTFLQRS